MLIRLVEGILQQPHIGRLHGPEHGLELRVAQAGLRRRTLHGSAPPAHVDDADHAHSRVGLEAVRGEAVVDGLEEAEIAREADAGGGIVAGAQLEHVDCGGE